MKYVVDSVVTEGATSSGPRGISPSTTVDDDVFTDGTLREVEGKTPDSEGLMVRVSPGAVRQEVTQAIIDKKGTLIILKEEKLDTGDKEISLTGEKEVFALPRAVDAEKFDLVSSSKDKDTGKEDVFAFESHMTLIKTVGPKTDMKADDLTQIKSTDSPKKAMASWISEETKAGASEFICTTTCEIKETKTSDGPQQKENLFNLEGLAQFKQLKTHLTQNAVFDSSSSSLEVVLYENPKQQHGIGCLPPCLHLKLLAHCLPSSNSQFSKTTV